MSQSTNYLFGDSTPSTLKTNFLEFLRDALDFSVFVVQADERIVRIEDRMERLRTEADEEMARLDAFVENVTRAIQEAPKGAPSSPTAQCADHLSSLANDALRASLNRVREKLAAEIADAEAEITTERAASAKALGDLLVPHDPPDATSVTAVAMSESGYSGTVSVESALGLAYSFDLSLGEGFNAPLRVERFVPLLEIKTPQLAGWMKKEVKVRPQKIDKHILTQVSEQGGTLSFKLRAEPTMESGFDIDVSRKGGIAIERIEPKEDSSVGSFELDEEDTAKVADLASKIRTAFVGGKRQKLTEATLEGADFMSLSRFVPFVENLIAMMAPITREIQERSLTPNELVIRRLLGNDRREEIFVTKAALREKYAPLSREQRAIFTPLGLDAPGAARPISIPAAAEVHHRAEIRPSAPPPAPSKPPRAASEPPREEARTETAPAEEPAAAEATEAAKPEPEIPPAPATDPEVAQVGAASSMSLRVSPDGASKSEGLKNALKKIVGLVKKGSTEEAYRGYAALFASDEFVGCRVEDQRQALRIMVLTKVQPQASGAVIAAHRVALDRLTGLVDSFHEPADYEMLGVTQALLGAPDAAKASFTAGLAIEKERNPSSELYTKLANRVEHAN